MDSSEHAMADAFCILADDGVAMVEAASLAIYDTSCSFEKFARMTASRFVYAFLAAGGAFDGRYDLARCSLRQSACEPSMEPHLCRYVQKHSVL